MQHGKYFMAQIFKKNEAFCKEKDILLCTEKIIKFYKVPEMFCSTLLRDDPHEVIKVNMNNYEAKCGILHENMLSKDVY